MIITEKNIFAIMFQALPVFRKNLKYLLVITLLAFVPVFVFRLFLPAQYAAAFAALMTAWGDAWLAGADGAALTAIAASHAFDGAANYILMFYGIELVFFSLSTAAATYLAGKHLAEEDAAFGEMFNAVMPRFPKMVVTTLIAFAFIYVPLSFGNVLLMLLALYFAVGMVFYQQVVTDLGNWGPRALTISRMMVRGRWFRVLFGASTLIILYAAVYAAIGAVAVALGSQHNIFIALPMFLLQHFILSFFAVAFSVWYFDLKRVNKLRFEEIERHFAENLKQLERFGKKEDDENND